MGPFWPWDSPFQALRGDVGWGGGGGEGGGGGGGDLWTRSKIEGTMFARLNF